MSQDFKLEQDLANNKILIHGNVTFANANEAFIQSKNLLQDMNYIIFDLAGLIKADSSCLALLTSLIRHAKSQNKNFVITNMPKFLSDLGRVSGLDVIMPITG